MPSLKDVLVTAVVAALVVVALFRVDMLRQKVVGQA